MQKVKLTPAQTMRNVGAGMRAVALNAKHAFEAFSAFGPIAKNLKFPIVYRRGGRAIIEEQRKND